MIPSSIIVFGKSHEIKIVKELKDDDGNRVDGLFCSKTSTISIDKELPHNEKVHTLIHELGHAMFYRVSLGQTDIDTQIEEIIVNNMATMMTETFNIRFKGNK